MTRKKKNATAEEKCHMDKVAQLPCAVTSCGCVQVELHHPRRGMGMGQRASHFDVIPLCARHHRIGGFGVALHAGQKTFEKNFGTEDEMLARTLAKLENF